VEHHVGVLVVIARKITYTIFGGARAPSYIHVYEKGRENNSNARGN